MSGSKGTVQRVSNYNARNGPVIHGRAQAEQEKAHGRAGRDETVHYTGPAGEGIQSFPAKYFEVTEDDERIELKRELVRGQPLGQVYLEPRDIEYLKTKRRELSDLEYDRWLYNSFDMTNPYINKLVLEANPETKNRQLRNLYDKLSKAEKIGVLGILGPSTTEDFFFVHSLHTHPGQMPDLGFWLPPGTAPGQKQHSTMARGMFNPFRKQVAGSHRFLGANSTGIANFRAPGRGATDPQSGRAPIRRVFGAPVEGQFLGGFGQQGGGGWINQAFPAGPGPAPPGFAL